MRTRTAGTAEIHNPVKTNPMSHKPAAVSVLQEGMAYAIYLKDGRKIDNAIYYACIVSGKPYFGKGDDVYPAEDV